MTLVTLLRAEGLRAGTAPPLPVVPLDWASPGVKESELPFHSPPPIWPLMPPQGYPFRGPQQSHFSIGPSGPCIPHWWPYTWLPRLSFGPGQPSTFPSCPHTSGYHCWEQGEKSVSPPNMPAPFAAICHCSPLSNSCSFSIILTTYINLVRSLLSSTYKAGDYLTRVVKVHSTVTAREASWHPLRHPVWVLTVDIWHGTLNPHKEWGDTFPFLLLQPIESLHQNIKAGDHPADCHQLI